MPPVRTSRMRKPPPAGFDDIEDTLLEFSNKMKDAENASHEGKKRHEVMWPIFQISHQRKYIHLSNWERRLHHICLSPFHMPSHLKLTSISRIPLHLRPLLRKVRYFKATLRMAAEEQLCRRRADREMEEAGLREAVLSALRAD